MTRLEAALRELGVPGVSVLEQIVAGSRVITVEWPDRWTARVVEALEVGARIVKRRKRQERVSRERAEQERSYMETVA